MWVGSIQSMESLNRTKAEEFAPFSLPHAWSRTSLSPSFGLGFTPSASLVLRPLDSDWITAWALLGLQFADGRLWDFSASIYNHINQFPQINVSIANSWHCCYSGEHWLNKCVFIYLGLLYFLSVILSSLQYTSLAFLFLMVYVIFFSFYFFIEG